MILNKRIYYPQGGGQPADTGSIVIQNKYYEVYDVRHVDGEIRHCISCDLNTCLPQAAQLKVSQSRRMLNTRYHTAGHLIAAVVKNMDSDLSVTKGRQLPGEACDELTRKLENIEKVTRAEKLYDKLGHCDLSLKISSRKFTALKAPSFTTSS